MPSMARCFGSFFGAQRPVKNKNAATPRTRTMTRELPTETPMSVPVSIAAAPLLEPALAPPPPRAAGTAVRVGVPGTV